jgi:hypothetical protein
LPQHQQLVRVYEQLDDLEQLGEHRERRANGFGFVEPNGFRESIGGSEQLRHHGLRGPGGRIDVERKRKRRRM